VKLIPQGHRVFLLLDEVKEKEYKSITTDAGEEKTLWLPDKHGERSRIATVLAVGEGWENEQDGTIRPLKFKKGDRVLVSYCIGPEIHLPDRDMATGCYVCISAEEILMKVKEEDKPEIEGEDE